MTYFDKRRGHWVARVSVNGNRLYVGSASSQKVAQGLEDNYMRELQREIGPTHSSRSELDKFPLHYEITVGVFDNWLRNFRRAWSERKKRRAAARVEANQVRAITKKLDEL